MRKLLLAVPLLGLMASAGCASAQAKAADRPALVVPPPPARVVEPAEVVAEPLPDVPSPPSGTPANSAAPRSSRPALPRPAAGDAKPDPAPPAVEPLPPVTPPPAAPPAQLRTPQTADPNGAARAVRTTIDTARGLLNSVDFGAQSNERKKAYNDAKLFMQQAEEALKEGNLGLAQGIASKAETLARELAGR
jgi:hypothetical protein